MTQGIFDDVLVVDGLTALGALVVVLAVGRVDVLGAAVVVVGGTVTRFEGGVVGWMSWSPSTRTARVDRPPSETADRTPVTSTAVATTTSAATWRGIGPVVSQQSTLLRSKRSSWRFMTPPSPPSTTSRDSRLSSAEIVPQPDASRERLRHEPHGWPSMATELECGCE